MTSHFTRRDAIKLGTAATVAVSLGIGEAACSRTPSGPPAPRTSGGFFTSPEFELVDELSEMIIPADEHSPGGRAAKVASFIDGQLAEAWDPEDRTKWRAGLALVDRLSQDDHAKSFMQASADQRIAVLTRMAQNESKPQTPEERFFVELKGRVVHAYYTTEIGIKEMDYKGNVILTEFVGEDAT